MDSESIGIARMDSNGKIIMQLRASGENGIIGDGQFIYETTNPEYQNIIKHLGGLKPGEEKPVPPFD